MMKLKVVENEKLKVLTCVRTHPEELLAPKKLIFLVFLNTKGQEWSLGPYDKIKKCSDCHLESSHMCKNSSRRTPRPQNFFCFLSTKDQEMSLGP